MNLYKTTYQSPFGTCTLVGDEQGLSGLWFNNQKYFCEGYTKEKLIQKDEYFIDATNWLDRYFSGEKPDIFELKLNARGSEFRIKVWEALCKIPYGKTVTYGEIAKELSIQSPRAIGNAVSHNPILIIVPCHRVVGKNSGISGYSAGIATKINLLKHEKVNLQKFNI